MKKPFSLPPPPAVSLASVAGPPLPGCFLSCWHNDRSPARPVGAPDLACFVAPPPPACLLCSAPPRRPRSLPLAGSPARPLKPEKLQQQRTTKPAESGSLASEIGTNRDQPSRSTNIRQKQHQNSGGINSRINTTAAGKRARIEDRGIWKLPKHPKTGRARSASPGRGAGDPPGHTQTGHRGRARPRPLRRARAGYRAPAGNVGAL